VRDTFDAIIFPGLLHLTARRVDQRLQLSLVQRPDEVEAACRQRRWATRVGIGVDLVADIANSTWARRAAVDTRGWTLIICRSRDQEGMVISSGEPQA
jgi:hypothetical protein